MNYENENDTIIINNEKVKRNYNKQKNGKKIGRPTNKTEDEIKANRRKLEKEYSVRRGRFITKINYYIDRYEIPQELQLLAQETDEDVVNKCRIIYDYAINKRWAKFTPLNINLDNTDTSGTETNSNTSEAESE